LIAVPGAPARVSLAALSCAIFGAGFDALAGRFTFAELSSTLKKLMVSWSCSDWEASSSALERISNGDIPPKISDSYQGDFHTLKNNLNTCTDAVNALITDANALSVAAVEGKLATRADAEKHHGDFRRIIAGVLLASLRDVVRSPLDVVHHFGEPGFLPAAPRAPP
jgi:hypothetical protein